MDGAADQPVCRLHHSLTEGWMGVNHASEIFSGTFETEDCAAFTDQVSSVGADDVDSEDLTVLCICDDLEESGYSLADDSRFTQCREWELRHLGVVSRFLGGLLGQANTGHLGVTVCSIGNAVISDGLGVHAVDTFDGDDSFCTGDMCQLGSTEDDISDGVDVRAAGALVRLHRNESASVLIPTWSSFSDSVTGFLPTAHSNRSASIVSSLPSADLRRIWTPESVGVAFSSRVDTRLSMPRFLKARINSSEHS
jgi:hypothetical protein